MSRPPSCSYEKDEPKRLRSRSVSQRVAEFKERHRALSTSRNQLLEGHQTRTLQTAIHTSHSMNAIDRHLYAVSDAPIRLAHHILIYLYLGCAPTFTGRASHRRQQRTQETDSPQDVAVRSLGVLRRRL